MQKKIGLGTRLTCAMTDLIKTKPMAGDHNWLWSVGILGHCIKLLMSQ